jgi:hypothetical protein
MNVALFALLALNAAAMLGLVMLVVGRRRAVKGRPGVFKGKIRVAEGELDGLSRQWTSGYGHWVSDVLVWDMAPLLLRSRLIPVAGTDASGIRPARGKAASLGKHTIIAPLLSAERCRLELAAADEHRDLALGPFARASAVGSLVHARFDAGERRLFG